MVVGMAVYCKHPQDKSILWKGPKTQNIYYLIKRKLNLFSALRPPHTSPYWSSYERHADKHVILLLALTNDGMLCYSSSQPSAGYEYNTITNCDPPLLMMK